VTFKDLQRLVQSQSGPEQSQLLQRLRHKPFWIWELKQHKSEDIKTKGDCCFNHIIGLPTKDGIEKSIFDYEKLLYDSLLIPEFYNDSKHNFKHKHLWVKKATGLGVTEFILVIKVPSFEDWTKLYCGGIINIESVLRIAM
jgi:hypothetical protein